MFKPISWQAYVCYAPDRAMEMKLLALIDQYAVSQDIAEMLRLAEQIDMLVGVVARGSRHYGTLTTGNYTALNCKEITLAGYVLSVQPTGRPAPGTEFLYKVYFERDGRNVLTSSWL